MLDDPKFAVVKRYLQTGHRLLGHLGIDPRTPISTVRHLGSFIRDLRRFQALAETAEARFPFGTLYPCLGEKVGDSGNASGHYFHQDLLVARRIFERQPERHVDVGSRVDGFVAHVASFRAIEVFDIRPMTAQIPNVIFRQADLMNLPEAQHGYADSVSSLHAIEHFGLGRYGDPIDPDGHVKGVSALHRLVKPGGTLYLSVPMGPDRVEFNAHRVFSLGYLTTLLKDRFSTLAFSYVDDRGRLREGVMPSPADVETSFGCDYGCAIFELRRP